MNSFILIKKSSVWGNKENMSIMLILNSLNCVNYWFNLILDNGEDAYEKPNASDSRRAAALRAWCALNHVENQNSRNELNLQRIRE